MPNRIVRDGILTSPSVAKLGWPEEVFYRRLMSVVDDFGRYFGDPGVLRAACYPRQLNKVSDSDVGKWLHACVAADLVRVYRASDRENYIELVKFGQQVRAKKSKYPDEAAPDEQMKSFASNCEQEKSNAHLDVSVSVSVSEDVSTSSPAGDGPLYFDEFWKAYPKKVGKDAARKEFDKRKVGRLLLDSMLSAIAKQGQSKSWTDDGGKYIPNPATWLNEGRWQDEGVVIPITAPAPRGPDPALAKIEADRLKATPIPENIRQQLQSLRGNGVPA